MWLSMRSFLWGLIRDAVKSDTITLSTCTILLSQRALGFLHHDRIFDVTITAEWTADQEGAQ